MWLEGVWMACTQGAWNNFPLDTPRSTWLAFPTMKKITRRFDRVNLVEELARNKVDALELLREALSNAKDHRANRVWIKTSRGRGRSEAPDILLLNDGLGMGPEELAAFWGVSASVKPDGQAIGYKGHGTKLYFASNRLHVATRCKGDKVWRYSKLDHPDRFAGDDIDEHELSPEHRLWKELNALGLLKSEQGVAIGIEECQFRDAAERLLSRKTIESYCDWFTVVGDVRSGLFTTRQAFHETVVSREGRYESLRVNEVALRPLEVQLSINGEEGYFPLGQGPSKKDKAMLQAWAEDRKAYASQPGVLAFGHRFADHHEPHQGAKRVRDDMTALCLVSPESFGDDTEFAIVMRIEGHRRQRETYLEAQWQGHPGVYSFDERFGLWLCKDFIPVLQQNEWLREAIDRAAQKKDRLNRYEIKTLRNWQVFVNYQRLMLTANRNDISNLREIQDRVIMLLAKRIEQAFDEDAFADWVNHMQHAVTRGQREKEVRQMERRVDKVKQWIGSAEGVEPMEIAILERRSETESLRLPEPANEQELFHLYAVVSGIFQVPLRVIRYETREGIDAVAQVHDVKLLGPGISWARVEFKNVLKGNEESGHFFDAIDAFICWKVEMEGMLHEGGDSELSGQLRKRKAPRTSSRLDLYEVEYMTAKNETRIIPVLTLETLFKKSAPKKKG